MHMRTQQSNKTGECMSLTLVRRSTRLGLLPSVVCFEKRNKPSVVLEKKGKRKKEKRNDFGKEWKWKGKCMLLIWQENVPGVGQPNSIVPGQAYCGQINHSPDILRDA